MWQDEVLYWAWRGDKPADAPPPTEKRIVYAKNRHGSNQARIILDIDVNGAVVKLRMPYEDEFSGVPLSEETLLALASHASPQIGELHSVLGEAYQVIASLASDLDKFEDDAVEKALDNCSEMRMVHDDVLPFPSFKESQTHA